jgi:hypothetical protein
MGLPPEWRNWQTRGTQNPESFQARVGSIPTSGTTLFNQSLARIPDSTTRVSHVAFPPRDEVPIAVIYPLSGYQESHDLSAHGSTLSRNLPGRIRSRPPRPFG